MKSQRSNLADMQRQETMCMHGDISDNKCALRSGCETKWSRDWVRMMSPLEWRVLDKMLS